MWNKELEYVLNNIYYLIEQKKGYVERIKCYAKYIIHMFHGYHCYNY